MSDFTWGDIDPGEVLERLTLYAYTLFGCFPAPEFEPVLRVYGESPEDLAIDVIIKFLDPDDATVDWKSAASPTLDRLLPFLKKVLYNDFIDRKRTKRYRITAESERYEADEGDSGNLSLDELAIEWETPESQAIRSQRRERLLARFDAEPELKEILDVQLNAEGYGAFTNQQMGHLLGITVSEVENRKKRVMNRLYKILGEPAASQVEAP